MSRAPRVVASADGPVRGAASSPAAVSVGVAARCTTRERPPPPHAFVRQRRGAELPVPAAAGCLTMRRSACWTGALRAHPGTAGTPCGAGAASRVAAGCCVTSPAAVREGAPLVGAALWATGQGRHRSVSRHARPGRTLPTTTRAGGATGVARGGTAPGGSGKPRPARHFRDASARGAPERDRSDHLLLLDSRSRRPGGGHGPGGSRPMGQEDRGSRRHRKIGVYEACVGAGAVRMNARCGRAARGAGRKGSGRAAVERGSGGRYVCDPVSFSRPQVVVKLDLGYARRQWNRAVGAVIRASGGRRRRNGGHDRRRAVLQ